MLNEALDQEEIAMRTSLLLPMDDLLAVTREFINAAVSHSGMDRCLRRHGVSRLKALIPQEETPRSLAFSMWISSIYPKCRMRTIAAICSWPLTVPHADFPYTPAKQERRHPQTNGMALRFNGRISEILNTTRFDSSWNLEQTLINYAKIYHHHIPQKALGHIAPIQALQEWQKAQPELFTEKI